ncbi:MAG: HAD family hydrolase [Candidatus Nanohaloarchaea archaeon]
MDAVLFDMDGVIIDSEDYWPEYEAGHILPAAVEGEAPPVSEVKGINVSEMYDMLAETYEMAVDKAEFLGMYDDAAAEIYREKAGMMDGFADLVAYIRERGVKVGIVTSSPRQWIDIAREEFDFPEVDVFLSAGDIDGPGKPEPDLYEAAADRIGADIERCTAVEDSPNGAASAAAAGAFVIGFNASDDLDAADIMVRGPDELQEELAARIAQGDDDR